MVYNRKNIQRRCVIQYCQRKISTEKPCRLVTSGLTKSIALRVPQWSVLILFKALPKFRVASSDSFLPRRNPENRGFPLGLSHGGHKSTKHHHTIWKNTGKWPCWGSDLWLGWSFWSHRTFHSFFWNMLGWCWWKIHIFVLTNWWFLTCQARWPEGTPAGFRKTPPVLYSHVWLGFQRLDKTLATSEQCTNYI